MHKRKFTEHLARWHHDVNQRSLPWKNEKDPYKIWLSEIILQQTRAEQGLPYYLRFIETYPTVTALAAAKDEEVYRLWQGLGYYNRCKNMLATARHLSGAGGTFPDTYEGLLKLKGIGPYTAAAIASFAFGLPVAVVDGNVYRVLARYFGISEPFDTSAGKKRFADLACEVLHHSQSAAHNQAIMDLGATVCTPARQQCARCPLERECYARKHDMVAMFPVKSKKLVVRKRYFHYLVLRYGDKLWMQKRVAGDIWENLYEPYLVESERALDAESLMGADALIAEKIELVDVQYAGASSQRLTHQLIEAHFFVLELKTGTPPGNGRWVTVCELENIAMPKTVLSFLKNNLYF